MKDRELLFSIRKSDLNINWFSGSGAGGQHRNRHKNCVKITHRETGLSETCQEHREAQRNFKTAFRRLVKRVIDEVLKKQKKERYPAINHVRTYNMVDNYVKDSTGDTYTFSTMDMNEVICNRLKKLTFTANS